LGRGSIGEDWYVRYSQLFTDEALEAHLRFADPTGKTRYPDFVHRGGRIEGNTLVEVKSTREGLRSGHDVPQIREMLKLAQKRGNVYLGGEPVTISSARLVFTHVDGARAPSSIKALEDFFENFKDVLTVEVFLETGPAKFTDIAALKAALGV